MTHFSNTSYDLHLFGPFSPRKVRFRYNPRDRIFLDPDQQSGKRSIIGNLKRSGKIIEIRPLYRFLSVAEQADGIILDLGRTDFGEYLLTDISHPGWNVSGRGMPMSNPLSISAVTESSDHVLLMGCRSAAVVGQAGKIQTIPAGYIHPPALIPETVENELREELAVTAGETAGISVTGIARIHPSGKPEVLLSVRLHIPSTEILRRRGTDRWEFTRIFTIPAFRDPVADFLADPGKAMAPASHAALAAYAFHMFGIRPDGRPVADR